MTGPLDPLWLPVAFLSFGFVEILLVGVVALLVFGGDLPDVMRSLGRSYGKLRRSLSDLSRPVRDELRQVREIPPPRSSEPPTEDLPVGRADEEAEPEYPDYGAEEPDKGPHTEGVADEPPPV